MGSRPGAHPPLVHYSQRDVPYYVWHSSLLCLCLFRRAGVGWVRYASFKVLACDYIYIYTYIYIYIYEPIKLMGDLQTCLNLCSVQVLDPDPRVSKMFVYKKTIFVSKTKFVFSLSLGLLW